MKEVKILEVHVDKGMKHGQKITFGGEADQAPGVEPGDIVLVLQEKDNEVGGPVPQYCSHAHVNLPSHDTNREENILYDKVLLISRFSVAVTDYVMTVKR